MAQIRVRHPQAEENCSGIPSTSSLRSGIDFLFFPGYIIENNCKHVTYDHRLKRIGHPVRSAIHKLQIGRLVVGWVTTSEYLLLYVFFAFFWSRFAVEKRFF